MNKDLAQYFFAEASKALSFLTDAHLFSRPRLEVDERMNFATVVFEGRNLAIECILDEREEDLTCKVSRIVGGKPATSYAVDKDGVRVRGHLSQLLLERGVRERIRTPVANLNFRQRIPIFFSDVANALKKHGADILQDSTAVLDRRRL